MLAGALILIDVSTDLHFEKKWPLLFGAGAAGSRGLLTAVASSMITVAGVVFSITIVALSLTSSQYTSRILRNFRRDRINQSVLGLFLGVFAYCLVVLRTIREGSDGSFVPSLAVMGGLIMAFFGIGFLIFFIHHISMSIQASNIIAATAKETIASIDKQFVEEQGKDQFEATSLDPVLLTEKHWIAVPAVKTGYIEAVDYKALLIQAKQNECVIRMERGPGEFVIEGGALVSISSGKEMSGDTSSKLNEAFVIGRQRTVRQDVSFGIRQIVDVALKALSPGINDSTTAIMCIDYLTAIFVRLARRDLVVKQHGEDASENLILRGRSFVSLLSEGFDEIRQNAAGNSAVLSRQLHALETIAALGVTPHRQAALRMHVSLISSQVESSISEPHDAIACQEAVKRLEKVLGSVKLN